MKELLDESKANHPTADRLLDTYRQEMARARKFVVDHEIATIPAGETLRIEPTPPFLRPLMPYAAYMPPGFLEKVQEGIFLVTPVEEKDPDAAERRLRGHPRASIPVTALHEAYPGHHLQLCFANQVGTLPRKFGGFLSTLFVEGWAFYCEELMERLGFIGEPIQKLSRLQAQMWRAARIVIDVSLHTGAMSVDEAIRFLVEKAGLEPDDAAAEVKRYTQSPTQPQSYLMGKMQILAIVEEYKKAHPKSEPARDARRDPRLRVASAAPDARAPIRREEVRPRAGLARERLEPLEGTVVGSLDLRRERARRELAVRKVVVQALAAAPFARASRPGAGTAREVLLQVRAIGQEGPPFFVERLSQIIPRRRCAGNLLALVAAHERRSRYTEAACDPPDSREAE